jgi:hypothetical protein
MSTKVKVTATVEARKSAHGGTPKRTASFMVEVKNDVPTEAVKLISQVFPKEDGYHCEVVTV